jgi:hypothetical protein
MDKSSVPRTSRLVAFAVILGGRVVDGWVDPEWAEGQANMLGGQGSIHDGRPPDIRGAGVGQFSYAGTLDTVKRPW